MMRRLKFATWSREAAADLLPADAAKDRPVPKRHGRARSKAWSPTVGGTVRGCWRDPADVSLSIVESPTRSAAGAAILMICRAAFALLLLAIGCLETSQATVLNIEPIPQKNSNWCWLAVSAMVLTYYGVPSLDRDYQCGMVRTWGGLCFEDCHNPRCNVGGQHAAVIAEHMQIYSRAARQHAAKRYEIVADVRFYALTQELLKEEIDAGRPAIVGISPGARLLPPGLSQHAVLLVGYEEKDGSLLVYVNDPFPYRERNRSDPYTVYGGTFVRSGRYVVPYDSLVHKLNWRNTIWRIFDREMDE